MKPETIQASSSADNDYFWTRTLHDLKNPAGVVVGYADMLRRSDVASNPEKVMQYAEKIHFSSKLLLRLLEDLCQNQLTQNTVPAVKPKTTKTESLFRSIFEPYAVQAMQKDLSFDVDVENALPSHMPIDGLRLGQILGNIIDNAIKYTTRGGLRVILNYKPLEDLSGLLAITVTDTGCGFAFELKDEIFEPFFRVDPGSNQCTGQGLGLGSARLMAQRLGGSLHLGSSEIGRGSSFVLELPIRLPKLCHTISNIQLYVSPNDLPNRSGATFRDQTR